MGLWLSVWKAASSDFKTGAVSLIFGSFRILQDSCKKRFGFSIRGVTELFSFRQLEGG